jgi:membrane protease YdiL (CAAX protease family)
MQAFKSKPNWEKPVVSPAQTAGQASAQSDARLSLRAVTVLEIASVVGSVLLTIWAIAPIYPQSRWLMAVPGALALVLILHSQRVRGESWRELGFSSRHFGRALWLLLFPVGLGCVVMLLAGLLNDSLHRSTHFWANLLVVPVWGVLQQYVLQGFIYRRLRSLLPGQISWAIFVTAALFALVHLPNPPLTALTFVAALVWSWVYERAPNLWALGLSHGVLSLTLMHSLPPWLLQSMSVGYKHFLYQKF